MKYLNWFEIEVYYPIDASLFEDSELSEIERLTAGVIEGYETGVAYFNLAQSQVQSILPKCFIPKGKKQNKKFYSEIVFIDGSIALAIEKPNDVYKRLDEYLDNLPIKEDEESD